MNMITSNGSKVKPPPALEKLLTEVISRMMTDQQISKITPVIDKNFDDEILVPVAEEQEMEVANVY